jgi:hypothetical protein
MEAAEEEPDFMAATKIQILLDEFKVLREEISRRSRDQLSLIQINITAIGIILGFVFAYAKDSRVLLLIPLISSILGTIYLDNAEAISHIGRFIQTKVKPEMFRIIRKELPDYEKYVRGLELRRIDRVLLVGFPVLAVFGLLPIVALLVPFLSGIHFESHLNEEEIWIFAIPAILFLLLFVFYWIRFAWVSKNRQDP